MSHPASALTQVPLTLSLSKGVGATPGFDKLSLSGV